MNENFTPAGGDPEGDVPASRRRPGWHAVLVNVLYALAALLSSAAALITAVGGWDRI